MLNIDATSGMVSSNDCSWRSRVTWSRSPSELMKVSTSTLQRMNTTNLDKSPHVVRDRKVKELRVSKIS